jgi:regulatory protein
MGPDPLKAAALRLLARREHSAAELQRKLERRAARAVGDGEPAGASSGPATETAMATAMAITLAVQDLAARGLQSDARVAESVLAAQSRRHGQRRLAQTLKGKGLAAGLVESSLASVRSSEFERAMALWQQRFGQAPALQSLPTGSERQRQAARQARFLLARGFESEVVRRVLRQAGDEALAAAAEATDDST